MPSAHATYHVRRMYGTIVASLERGVLRSAEGDAQSVPGITQTHGVVTSVAADEAHAFSKTTRDEIELVAGLGVRGDAHFGAVVQHRSRVSADPTQPNLRQVHLIHAELHDELTKKGFDVTPGAMGENVTTRGIDLLGLPVGTILLLGASAILVVTGLRNPCRQIDAYQAGLMGAVLDRTLEGALVRKAGVMAVVVSSGVVRPGDTMHVALPPQPHKALAPI